MSRSSGVPFSIIFNLPDGPHHASGIVPTDRVIAKEHIERMLMTNPDTKIVWESLVHPATQAQADAAHAKVKQMQLERGQKGAEEMVADGDIDVQNRVLTDPEIARGRALV